MADGDYFDRKAIPRTRPAGPAAMMAHSGADYGRSIGYLAAPECWVVIKAATAVHTWLYRSRVAAPVLRQRRARRDFPGGEPGNHGYGLRASSTGERVTRPRRRRFRSWECDGACAVPTRGRPVRRKLPRSSTYQGAVGVAAVRQTARHRPSRSRRQGSDAATGMESPTRR